MREDRAKMLGLAVDAYKASTSGYDPKVVRSVEYASGFIIELARDLEKFLYEDEAKSLPYDEVHLDP